jgi:uncharacterized protein involved in exopolysaccharide biosynthesis
MYQDAPGSTKKKALDANDEGTHLWDVAIALAKNKWWLLCLPLAIAGLTYFGARFLPPTYSAQTVILPPQSSQSTALGMLQNLSGLSGIAGGGSSSTKIQAEQYISLMQSATLSDRIAKKFDLNKVYKESSSEKIREILAGKVKFSIGKKDGLLTIVVEDESPIRAAQMANDYVSQLKRMSGDIALTEAQQRRVFFEEQFQRTRAKLNEAQALLQKSGMDEAALRTEPVAAANAYAEIKSQVTAAEVKIQSMKGQVTDRSPAYKMALASLNALNMQLKKIESDQAGSVSGDYIGKYREYKYQEYMYEFFAKQVEMARLDESRDGALMQVVDKAFPPERKIKPRVAKIAAISWVLSFFIMVMAIAVRQVLRSGRFEEMGNGKMGKLKQALGFGV